MMSIRTALHVSMAIMLGVIVLDLVTGQDNAFDGFETTLDLGKSDGKPITLQMKPEEDGRVRMTTDHPGVKTKARPRDTSGSFKQRPQSSGGRWTTPGGFTPPDEERVIRRKLTPEEAKRYGIKPPPKDEDDGDEEDGKDDSKKSKSKSKKNKQTKGPKKKEKPDKKAQKGEKVKGKKKASTESKDNLFNAEGDPELEELERDMAMLKKKREQNERKKNDPNRVCPLNLYQCGTQECILPTYECDGKEECQDGSDEKGCPTVSGGKEGKGLKGQTAPTTKSKEGTQQESRSSGSPTSGSGKMKPKPSQTIPPSGGSQAKPKPSQTIPTSGGSQGKPRPSQTIPLSGGSQARRDRGPAPKPGEICPKHLFECGSRECIMLGRKCDGREDCRDGSDEKGCPALGSKEWKCPHNLFTCKNKECILPSYKCDGKEDCGDGSDEEMCPVSTSKKKKPITSNRKDEL